MLAYIIAPKLTYWDFRHPVENILFYVQESVVPFNMVTYFVAIIKHIIAVDCVFLKLQIGEFFFKRKR